MVFNLGDIFHSQETISVPTLYGTHLGLSIINEACEIQSIKHYAISGTHDTYNETLGIFSITVLDGCFSNPGILTGDVRLEENIGVIPYTSDPNKFYNLLVEFSDYTDLIVTHNDFAGARYENGHESESTVSPEVPVPVISGDNHLPQKIGNVIYVGSLVQHSFKQQELLKNGVLLYDTETKTYKRYFNTMSKHYLVVKNLDRVREFDPKQVILKVYTDLPKEELAPIMADYEYIYAVKMAKSSEIEETQQEPVEDPMELLRNYIEQDNPDALEAFKKITERKGEKL